ncbi:MAG: elongation factor Ts [Solirubrobacteraceae bacterium]|nr:elongation factor Ts [Solirubrobacteraceae bacterium]
MSTTVTAAEVKALRQKTGAGLMECKAALQESGGDAEKAFEALRITMGKKAQKLAQRETTEGLIGQYIHATGKVGVLVQVECNTDFVAGNDIFKDFVADLALHIAGSPSTLYVNEAEIPEDVLEAEKKIYVAQIEDNKPLEIREKIAEGKLRKWKEEIVLLDQKHINVDKHDNKTIEQLRADASTRTGENIVIKKFARFQIGA